MPIVDSGKNRIISLLTENEIRKKADEIRFYSNLSAYISGTADPIRHTALIDIAAILYFNYIFHDPMNPFWDKRDRVFWSDAELASVIYSTLGLCGYFPVEELLRLETAGFDRYPDRFKVPGIEVSVNCRGSGLGVAVGDALSARMDNSAYQVFCIMSGGEQSLGSVWEAAGAASKHKLDNLVAIVEKDNLVSRDRNFSESEQGMIADRYASFGWQVYIANSADPGQIIKILSVDRKKEKLPTVIIIDNLQNNETDLFREIPESIVYPDGIIESNSALKKMMYQEEDREISELEEGAGSIRKDKPRNMSVYSGKYSWNSGYLMKTDFLSLENVFINFMKNAAIKKENSLIFYAGRKVILNLKKKYLDLNKIMISVQNMILTASGLAKEGKIPFIVSEGLSSSEKNYNQLRNTVCLNNFNVKFIDLCRDFSDLKDRPYLGFSDDISAVLSIHNLNILFPSDSVEAEKMISCAAENYGPVLIRIPCGEFPVVTKIDTPCMIGTANIIRYRGIEEKFEDAFEIISGFDYSSEEEDLSILVFSSMVSEAMRASYILKEEFGIEARIVNIGSVTPIDEKTVFSAVSETKAVIVIGSEYSSGLADSIAGTVMKNSGCCFKNIIKNTENEKRNQAELTAEYITEEALELLNRKIVEIN